MSASVSSPIMVGRDGAIARLDGVLGEALSGRPRIVVVSGEAGIGKSRLLTEFGARAGSRGVRVLIGGCLDLADGGPPFVPFVQAVRRLVRSTPEADLSGLLGVAGRELGVLLPELAGPSAPPVAPPAPIDQGRLFELVLTLIGRLAEEAPLLVGIEDAHWIDRASRDLVTFLVHNLSSERVALVLTWRTDQLGPASGNSLWLGELVRGPAVERVDLQRLDREAVAELVRVIRGDVSSTALVDRTFERSDGNPFFVEELLTSDQPEVAPPTLDQALAAKLAALPDASRGPLAALAVAGRSVDDRLLEEVVGIPADALAAALREGIDRYILALDPETGGIRFRHVLLREVAAAAVLPGERRSLHERFARALEPRLAAAGRAPAALVADLARHWDGADRPDEAYDATVRAAASASLVAAHGRAHELYERAIELADRRSAPLDALTRIGLLRSASDEADLAGAPARAMELIGAAIDRARPLGDAAIEGELRGRRGFLLWRAGDPAAALAEHQAAVDLVPSEPPGEARARALAGLAGAHFALGHYAAARDVGESAVACARDVGAERDEARARNTVGSALVALGDLVAGLHELERSRDIAARVSPPETVVAARFNLALNLAQAGRLEDALAEVEIARGLMRESGLERRFGMDLAALAGDILMRFGRWAEADAATSEGFRIDPAGRGSAFLAMVRGRLDALRGDVVAATERLASVADDAAEALDADVAAYLGRGLVERELAARDPEAALARIDEMIGRLGDAEEPFALPVYSLGVRAAADLAESATASRDDPGVARGRSQAERLVARIPPGAEVGDAPATGTTPATRTAVPGPWRALAEAELSRAHGRPDPGLWAAAARALEALPDIHLAAYATMRSAEAELRLRGIRADVDEALRAAHRTAIRLGAEALRRDVEVLARRARVALDAPAAVPARPEPGAVPGGRPGSSSRPTDRAPTGRGPRLSERELEVLRLVAEGRTNGEIAERLFITRKTAGVHVTHILDKLGVANRVEAAMVGTQLGLLEDGRAS
jgi:DNA-binding CsgD family transcriptional regulator/tetratricopeptide (TPR) repeat protein